MISPEIRYRTPAGAGTPSSHLFPQKIGTYDQAQSIIFVYDSLQVRNRAHEESG
jgi:hypothetical protein